MIAIPIGVTVTLEEDVVYAVPSLSVEIETDTELESSLFEDSSFAAFTSAILTGCFVRCTTGDAIVFLRKNVV